MNRLSQRQFTHRVSVLSNIPSITKQAPVQLNKPTFGVIISSHIQQYQHSMFSASGAQRIHQNNPHCNRAKCAGALCVSVWHIPTFQC